MAALERQLQSFELAMPATAFVRGPRSLPPTPCPTPSTWPSFHAPGPAVRAMNNRSDRVQRPFERQGSPSCSPVTPLGAIEAASLRRGHHNHYIVDGDRVLRGTGAVRGCLNAPYARSAKRGFDHLSRRAAFFSRLRCCLGPRWDRHSPQILHRKSKREEIGRSGAEGSCIGRTVCIQRGPLYRGLGAWVFVVALSPSPQGAWR